MPDALDLPFDEPASFFVVLLLAILIGPIVARWVRLPATVGLVLVGTAVGPGGVGLLEHDGSVALFGGAGLLYLVFLAGLDLDRSSFRQRRVASVVFSLSTTVLPLALTTGAGLLLGLDLGAAVLIASAFTSHTLVTYPVAQRFGLTDTRASVIALGGTLVSTVVALLVLTVVAAAHRGTLGLSFWAGFVGGIALFFAAALTGLPRLASWFFPGLGTDRAVRYSFTLALPFGAALLAEVLGIEPIIGAFVAGLALNRYVSGDTLLRSCVFSGILTERAAQRIPRLARETPAIGAAVVVSIADIERAEPLVEIASAIAHRDRGGRAPPHHPELRPAPDEVVQLRDQLTERVESVALANGADLRSTVRIDVTASAGMLHTAIETDASSILLGWKGFSARGSDYFFGEDTDAILTLSPLPVLVCRTAPRYPSRIVVDLIQRDLAPSARTTAQLCVEVAVRLGKHIEVPVEIVSTVPEEEVRAVVGEDLPCVLEHRSSLEAIPVRTDAGDVVVGGLPPARAGLDRRAARLAGALPGRTVVMVAGR